MTLKPIVRSQLATRDAAEAVEYYRTATTADHALRLIDALEDAYEHVRRLPAAGSPRYGHGLRLRGLRSWPVRGYPYMVFYVERDHDIYLWRVLHTARDIPASLSEGVED